METRAAGRPSGPGWTPDLGSGLIVACSLLLAATVVVGRTSSPRRDAHRSFALRRMARWILSWQTLVCLVIASVLFVPVGRYALAVKLPFGLEFYRLTVAFVLMVWVASLLVDPAVRLRRTPLDGPVTLIVAASLCSIAVNFGRVAPLASAVLKGARSSSPSSFSSTSSRASSRPFPSSLRSRSSSCPAPPSWRRLRLSSRGQGSTSSTMFGLLPFLQFDGSGLISRYGVIRATGSADHPIALGVLLAMCLPLGVALARSRSILWSVPTVVTLVGIMATASRTPITAVAAATVVFLWLRPHDIRPLLPLVIPIAIVIKLVAPGSIGTVKGLFFPEGGAKSFDRRAEQGHS